MNYRYQKWISKHIENNVVCVGMNCIGTVDVFASNQDFPSIGDNCFIGIGAYVIGGTVLPDNSVVGAGAVVTDRYSKKECVLVGVPVKKIYKDN